MSKSSENARTSKIYEISLSLAEKDKSEQSFTPKVYVGLYSVSSTSQCSEVQCKK